jgi:NADPH:quinone reductase-like Zn-dependent oxidoreductase
LPTDASQQVTNHQPLPRTMVAGRIHGFGPPDVVVMEDIAVPAAGENQVLVRVAAAGVGPWDGWIRAGRSWLPQPLPLTLGSDIAGTIARVGHSVAGFTPGDFVFGVSNERFTGGYAEFTAASATTIAHAPANLSAIDAASVPVVAVTAWQMLFDHANARVAQNVFVHGGAGGVGAFAVQLARSAGMHVWASVNGNGADYVRGLGAERVIDTRISDLTTASRWADVVIDTVGGALQDQLPGIAKEGGILVSAAGRPNVELAAAKSVRALAFIVDIKTRDLTKIAQLLANGDLKPNVGTVLPLREARTAHAMLDGLKLRGPGKIVLQIS